MELLCYRLIVSIVALVAFWKFEAWSRQPDLNTRDTFRLWCWGVIAGGSGLIVCQQMLVHLTDCGPTSCSVFMVAGALWLLNISMMYFEHECAEKQLRQRIAQRRTKLQEERDRWGPLSYDPDSDDETGGLPKR